MGRQKTVLQTYTKCPFEVNDCFALIPGHMCYCLGNTDFGGKECPFYKSEAAFLGEPKDEEDDDEWQ